MSSPISIRGARLHNLKNIDLDIPRNRLVVLSGLSGSGKSTLGFDILYKEGARQYIESLGLAPFGVSRPPLESLRGLSPTISVDQHLTHHSPRSTVGTATDVYTYLRILFARLGERPCPACGQSVGPAFEALDADWSGMNDEDGQPEPPDEAQETFPCPHCGAPVPELDMASFSFNKPAGACPTCTGLGQLQQADLTRLVDSRLSIADGAVLGWEERNRHYQCQVLQAAGAYYGFNFDPHRPVQDLPELQRDLLFYGVESARFRRHFPGREPPATVGRGRFEGLATNLLRRYAEHIHAPDYRQKMDACLITHTCPDCQGTRLRPESRAVRVAGQDIVSLARLPLTGLADWLAELPARLGPEQQRLAGPLRVELEQRLARLLEVGVGYLCLERAAPSLSAGEAQRLRMAALLGSGLTGVLYVLDEPTIGLHARDTQRLIGFLRRLRDLENTVLVIEHDLEVIRCADYVIDIGPGAGQAGGRVVASGTPDQVAANPASLTGDFLAGRRRVSCSQPRRTPGSRCLTIVGARQHNLQNLTVRIPLGLLVAVSGVSGSGKSSLIFDILERAARQHFYRASQAPGAHDRIEGWEHLEKVITIDQAAVGRLPRSNVATYAELFTPIREVFAATPEARRLNLSARHFSFNMPGGRYGRCERCQGTGVLAVSMHFLPDVEVRCPACQGRRFTRETLAVQYRQQHIAGVLDLTVAEALELFQAVPPVVARLQVLADVGLGYLQLGQPTTTLSGGEAQRVKLGRELARRSGGRSLYLLDEPTTGLHPADTERLLEVLQRLVQAGSSVVVVEHNLDLLRAADWIIDLGPEGGAAGGRLLAEGSPEQVRQAAGSYTGQALAAGWPA